MNVLLDEMLPPQTREILIDHQVSTVQAMGWSGIKNGELLKRAQSNFDVFLTADKNLQYQQNLKNLGISIVVLPSNRIEIILGLTEKLKTALHNITRGTLIEL